MFDNFLWIQQFYRKHHVADNLFDKADGKKLLQANVNVYRDNDNNLGITQLRIQQMEFLAVKVLVQIEHVCLLDNRTVSCDRPRFRIGYRQERIKVLGYRTDDWTGGLNIPDLYMMT